MSERDELLRATLFSASTLCDCQQIISQLTDCPHARLLLASPTKQPAVAPVPR